MDSRPGGMFLGCQKSPEGMSLWGKFVYQEVIEPEKLVYIQSFSDEQDNTLRAPFNPNWPLEITNNLTNGKTTVTFSGGPVHQKRRRQHSNP